MTAAKVSSEKMLSKFELVTTGSSLETLMLNQCMNSCAKMLDSAATGHVHPWNWRKQTRFGAVPKHVIVASPCSVASSNSPSVVLERSEAHRSAIWVGEVGRKMICE